MRICGRGLKVSLTLLLGLAGGCGSNAVIQEVWSPDWHHKAVVFTYRGGATVRHNTIVSVLDDLEAGPGRSSVAFSAENGTPDSPVGPYMSPVVELKWLDGRTLQIAYDPRAEVFQKRDSMNGVRIVYLVQRQKGIPLLGDGAGQGARTRR
jgi:hypothetical protein